jgi:phage FluMu protein Com
MPVQYVCRYCDIVLYEVTTRSDMFGKPLRTPRRVFTLVEMQCPRCHHVFSLDPDTYEITLRYKAYNGTPQEVTC